MFLTVLGWTIFVMVICDFVWNHNGSISSVEEEKWVLYAILMIVCYYLIGSK